MGTARKQMAPIPREPARQADAQSSQGAEGNQARLEMIAAGASQAVPERARFEQAFGADFGSVRTMLGGPEASGVLDACLLYTSDAADE